MFISQVGHFPTARSTLDKPFFDQEGLIHFFQGTGIFADSSSNRRQAHRSSLKFFNNGEQDFIVHFIQPVFIDIQCFECITGDVTIDASITFDHCKIAHSAQQCIGDTGCTPAPGSDFHSSLTGNPHIQDSGRTGNDSGKDVGIVIFQMAINTEPSPQGSGQ